MISIRLAVKYIAGGLSAALMPSLTREMDENRNPARAVKLKRAIHYYRTQQLRKWGDTASLQNSLTTFWAGEAGDSFHASYIDHRVDLFKAIHAPLIDKAARQAAAAGSFRRLVEIGCGRGGVLAHTAQRIDGLDAIIGLDINASAIKSAQSEYTDRADLTFKTAEICAWFDHNSASGTILLSYGGVLEYLSQSSVAELFKGLVTSPPAMVILVEPVAPDHDLTQTHASFAFGMENSFSHNHAHLLQNAGFKISHSEEIHHKNIRWMLMIALASSAK